MGLTSLPTRISGSLGAAKTDGKTFVYSTDILPSGEWNNSAKAVEEIASEQGLTDGSTSGSLVAKIKEFVRISTQNTDQFTLYNPLPGPGSNSGWIDPQMVIVESPLLLGGTLMELRAAGIDSDAYHAAIWWINNPFPFQPMTIQYTFGLNADGEVPIGAAVMAGIVFAGDRDNNTGIGSYLGFSPDSGSGNWFIRHDSLLTGSLLFTSSVGAYFSKTSFDVFGSHQPGNFPVFITEERAVDIIGNTSYGLHTSALFGEWPESWGGSTCQDFGIVLFGSASFPVTVSISNVVAYPTSGNPGQRTIF